MPVSVQIEESRIRCPACHGLILQGDWIYIDAITKVRFHESCKNC